MTKLTVPTEDQQSGQWQPTGQPQLLQANSFLLDKGTFVRQDVAIWENGVAMKDSSRNYVVKPDELIPAEILGSLHLPTESPAWSRPRPAGAHECTRAPLSRLRRARSEQYSAKGHPCPYWTATGTEDHQYIR